MNATTIATIDDQTNLINLIKFLNKTISQYGLGLIWLMGNIGAVLTCLVFYQPIFRKSPCAMYFLASSFAQFFTYNFALFTRMLQYGFDIQIVNTDLWFCKVRYYLFYLCIANSRYNIIIASIDRYFASSRDVVQRQWSSSKIAVRVIIGMIIFWCIMYIQVLVFYQLRNQSCQYQGGTYGTFFSIYIALDSGILPIILMLIFGLLTVRNIHKSTQRICPIMAQNDGRLVHNTKISKTDGQLHKMLINQIVLFIVLNVPNPCYLLYQSFTMHSSKSLLRSTTETFLSNMTYVLVYLGFSLTFVNFTISSQIFRRELLNIIRTKIIRRLFSNVQTKIATTLTVGRGTEIH
ncbi:hypothetical protein I4U23_027971 [Adineta vaga]|nr:hypothetical protein I4U23_027971 [Adineta vaga]